MSYPCAACGSLATKPYADVMDVEYFTSDKKFTYLSCEKCGAISLENPPIDQLSRIYPPNYYSFQPSSPGLGARIKDKLDQAFFRRCLSRFPNRPLAVMDVGGGSGHQLTLIRKLDSRVQKTVIVDLDDKAESIATAAGHTYFNGRIEDYQPDTKFDLIVALNLIEHVANPSEVLTKMRNALAAGGVIIIKTPNIDSWDHRLFRHQNWGGYHCPRHWVLFDRASFLATAQGAGLRATSFAYTQGAPFWAVSLLAALQRRGLARLDANHPAYRHPLYGVFTIAFAGLDFLRRPFAKTSQMFVTLEHAESSN